MLIACQTLEITPRGAFLHRRCAARPCYDDAMPGCDFTGLAIILRLTALDHGHELMETHRSRTRMTLSLLCLFVSSTAQSTVASSAILGRRPSPALSPQSRVIRTLHPTFLGAEVTAAQLPHTTISISN